MTASSAACADAIRHQTRAILVHKGITDIHGRMMHIHMHTFASLLSEVDLVDLQLNASAVVAALAKEVKLHRMLCKSRPGEPDPTVPIMR